MLAGVAVLVRAAVRGTILMMWMIDGCVAANAGAVLNGQLLLEDLGVGVGGHAFALVDEHEMLLVVGDDLVRVGAEVEAAEQLGVRLEPLLGKLVAVGARPRRVLVRVQVVLDDLAVGVAN